MSSTSTTNSFMITNRAKPTSDFGQEPLPGADLWWYLSPNPNDEDYRRFEPQSSTGPTAPQSFSDAIIAQLRAQESPSLTIFIHGLDCFWVSAVKYTGVLGANLAQAGYEGRSSASAGPATVRTTFSITRTATRPQCRRPHGRCAGTSF
jgi:hypothetical protein